MSKNFSYIKRDQGIFHRKNVSIEELLEQEFDNIVTMTNRALKTKEEQTLKVATQVTDIGKKTSLDPVADSPERLIYGGENRTVIRPIVATDTVLAFASIEPGDLIKIVTMITKTPDTGITDFKINDGADDLGTLGDIDVSIASVNPLVKSAFKEYTDYRTLTMYLAGATTFVGLIVTEILRKPIQYSAKQGFLG